MPTPQHMPLKYFVEIPSRLLFSGIGVKLGKTKAATHFWYDDCEFRVQGVVHLPNGTFVTPERVVVLCVLGVRVPGCGEDLVPGRRVAVRLWDTVRWLPAGQKMTFGWNPNATFQREGQWRKHDAPWLSLNPGSPRKKKSPPLSVSSLTTATWTLQRAIKCVAQMIN